MRRLIADQAGFTMVTVMGSMGVATLIALAVYTAVLGDIPIARADQDRKAAQDAADAGLSWYGFQLKRDPSYWTKCTAVPDPDPSTPTTRAPVNNAWSGSGADPRQWRAIPESSGKYTIELLPATGKTACDTDPGRVGTSMLDRGLLRVRATGQVGAKKRSIVAAFRKKTFLDFVYFTDYETLDPVTFRAYDVIAAGIGAQAEAKCTKWVRQGRRSERIRFTYNGQQYEFPCTDIVFPTGDVINGPLHTNDELLVCGRPVFGRSSEDDIEVSGPAGHTVASGARDTDGSSCTDNPDFKGRKLVPSATLPLPPNNAELKQYAGPSWTFTGTTDLEFAGNQLNVTERLTGVTRSLTLPPPNGVIYVQSHAGTACPTYSTLVRYSNEPNGCGKAYVKGTYNHDVTVGSDDDIIIPDNFVAGNVDAMAGLIANNFVRIYHPVDKPTLGECFFIPNDPAARPKNLPGTKTELRIEAGILALNHSFIVDNYHCGERLQKLKVKGAIAQRFRGPVGKIGYSGYTKDYEYDDRFRFREPPRFLDPVQSAWRLIRATEQQPAR